MDRNLMEIVERSIGRDPLETMEGLTTWTLANMADCFTPDAVDSPGAKFLERIREAVLDAIRHDWLVIDEDADNGDAVHEIADGAVSVYAHERWTTFVDLGAYREDISDLGFEGPVDLTQAAGVALYMIAERLAYDLVKCATDSVLAAREGATDA